MSASISLLAYAALSAAGRGSAALGLSPLGERGQVFAKPCPTMQAEGFRRPLSVRLAPEHLADCPASERHLRLLELLVRDLKAELERVLVDWRERRIALILGTSAGAMPALEVALAQRAAGEPVPRELAEKLGYAAPLGHLEGCLGVPLVSSYTVLAACASSSLALGLGARLLTGGHAELVIVGGYDVWSSFVAGGFEALGATTGSACRPFRAERDGMVVGEGGALAALVAEPARGPYLVGFGCASEAFHATAPHPEGHGPRKAAKRALEDAGLSASSVNLVSAHGTATPYNDRAEALALASLGLAPDYVVHGAKATLGHTMGAAGLLETLAMLEAMRGGLLPATAGDGALEPEFTGRLLERTEAGTIRAALKLASAFGGFTAALLWSDAPSEEPRLLWPVRFVVGPAVTGLELELARRLCTNINRLERLEPSGELTLGAVTALLASRALTLPSQTAVVLATELGSLESNERFDLRRRTQGPKGCEPRRFPATSPNLAAAEVSLALGLHGACFAVCHERRTLAEALLVGHDLVACHDAEACLVVQCDEVGPTASALLEAKGSPPKTSHGRAVLFVRGAEHAVSMRAELIARLRQHDELGSDDEAFWSELEADLTGH